jgi:hypothetical protein
MDRCVKALTADEHTRLETLMRVTEPVTHATMGEKMTALEACRDIFANFSALMHYTAMKVATRGTRAEAYLPGVTGTDLNPLHVSYVPDSNIIDDWGFVGIATLENLYEGAESETQNMSDKSVRRWKRRKQGRG